MIYDCIHNICLSRTGQEYKILYNTSLFTELNKCRDMCLDGELYIHNTSFSFEEYGILRKTKELNDTELTKLELIEYHVYDYIDPILTFAQRWSKLILLFRNNKFIKIKLVKTFECNNKNDIDEYHKQFLNSHYEGSILRNKKGLYVCKKRSYDLQKYKNFDDNEFKIVDFTFEKNTNGNLNHLIVWICETDNGILFNVPSIHQGII
jgi:ATP-dependent DNA ligase